MDGYCGRCPPLARWEQVWQRRGEHEHNTSRQFRSRIASSAVAGRRGRAAGASLGVVPHASAAPVTIRYATGGGIGPNEMETIIYLDYLKQNVLKNYGKSYTLEMTFTRGTPEAATLLASGQADLGTLAFSTFATAIAKNAVAGGLSIISDNYQDGHAGNATNTFFVQKDSPIKTVADLKGKKVGINAYGSAVDLVLRVVLKKQGLDPKRDVQIVEVNFPNMASAIREKRIDCGVLVIPFLAVESRKGDLVPAPAQSAPSWRPSSPAPHRLTTTPSSAATAIAGTGGTSAAPGASG